MQVATRLGCQFRALYESRDYIDRELISSRTISFFAEYCRPKKGTAIPGFEPSTLGMPKASMRYDALDRSTTTAGLLHSLFILFTSVRLIITFSMKKFKINYLVDGSGV